MVLPAARTRRGKRVVAMVSLFGPFEGACPRLGGISLMEELVADAVSGRDRALPAVRLAGPAGRWVRGR